MHFLYKSGKTSKGFTLVELSLVLVIIGLIVGGVLIGRDLIFISKMSKIQKEVNDYKSAFNIFRDKFAGQIPGDFKYATRVWPGVTDDGNGNQRIMGASESYLLWQHLSLANLVGGNFTGLPEGTISALPGTNIPISSTGDIAYSIGSEENGWNNYIVFLQNRDTAFYPLNSAFTPKQAYWFDTKYDDSMPRLGEMQIADGEHYFREYDQFTGSPGDTGIIAGINNCSDDPSRPFDDPASQYDLSRDTIACTILQKF